MFPGTLTVMVLVPGTRHVNVCGFLSLNSQGESEVIGMQEHLLHLHTLLYSALFPRSAIFPLLSLSHTHLSTSVFVRTFIGIMY